MSGKFRLAVPVALAIVGLSGCSVTSSGTGKESSSPAFYFNQVKSVRDAHMLNVVEPESLAAAMPRRQGEAGESWSQVAFTGRVVAVEPGPARIYPRADPGNDKDEESEVQEVPYDSPEADGRTVVVTVQTDWIVGEPAPEGAVEIWVGTPGSTDPDEFLRSLRGLDQVAGVLDQHDGGQYYPILQGALLGTVDDAGTLSFPGIGDRSEEFLAGIDTVAEFRASAEQ